MIATCLWQRARGAWPMKLWWTQLALNFIWSPVFFGLGEIGLGLAVILLLLVVILAFISTAWHRHRLTALLFVPYAAWVAFASVLNASDSCVQLSDSSAPRFFPRG